MSCCDSNHYPKELCVHIDLLNILGTTDVIISSIINEEEVPVMDGREDAGETEMVGEQIIPSKYNEDTELKVTVDKSSHQFDFDLDTE